MAGTPRYLLFVPLGGSFFREYCGENNGEKFTLILVKCCGS
jgi:hypothetical protein